MDLKELTLDIDESIEIAAAPGDVFEGLLKRLGENNTTPGDQPMPMCLERWPGGRWFRDLSNGAGHLWGFVQVIKPPTLIELTGPMFMSYPVAGHLQLKLEPIAGGTKLSLRHRAFGMIDEAHRKGVTAGWAHCLDKVKCDCQ